LAAAARRNENDQLLVLFLGSTIGNFDRDAAERFLTEVRRILFRGDALLLGTDLEKPLPQLLAAYDDTLGVTAAFNLNLLARINRELGADFDLTAFRHEARYNTLHQRVEMHLRSMRDQTVGIPRAGCSVSFLKEETVWTESSHKYRAEDIPAMARRNGFRCDSQWMDTEWPFAESLLIAE
jgi:L-histidine N-alpha-methyltransferase